MIKLPTVPSSPAFFSFQEGPIGGNLHVQGQFGVHQFLVVTQQAGQVLLGLLQGVLLVESLLFFLLILETKQRGTGLESL